MKYEARPQRLRSFAGALPRARRWLPWLRWGTVAALIALLVLDFAFPPPLPKIRDTSTLVVARDGTPLRAFADRDGVWRYPAAPETVSPLYLQALLNYEDRWFWRHPGVNPQALVRAAGQFVRHGRVVSGGSTLTMQVARMLDRHSRTPWGKAKQMLRAVQLEAHLSKRDPHAVRNAHRSAAPSKVSMPRAGLISASRRRGCRMRKRRCWRCCRSRPADCVRIAVPTRRRPRATRCCSAWPTSASGRPQKSKTHASSRSSHEPCSHPCRQRCWRSGCGGSSRARHGSYPRSMPACSGRWRSACRVTSRRCPAHVGRVAGGRQRDDGGARLCGIGRVRRSPAAGTRRHGASLALAWLHVEAFLVRARS